MNKPKIKLPKIKVKNSGLITLQFFDDFPDGNLVIAEALKNVPFAIKRLYFINHLFNKKAKRGHHAHKKLEQIIFCLNGSFTINLDDGKTKQSLKINSPYYGLRLGPALWHTMSNFSADCVILVIAADYYQESDYLRNYEDFKKFVNR
ncbi:MAG: FdtA/QdtA family cupin domain-containing protein [Patescibacteria group bacterium]